MQKIKLLPEHEIHKIAAGQVVDRPANIVKELIENSIDAGSTQISLYIEDGGKELIRVSDNGCGMLEVDAKKSIQKHATSKIRSLDDLESINTFGFRGEALASISAVSKVTILTKEEKAEQGIKLEVQESNITDESLVPFNTGTDIIAKNLFYNVPARQKFLKKRETENRHITQLLHSFCLDYLAIHFKLFIDGKVSLNCPPTKDIVSRTAQIWGHSFAEHMIPIEVEKPDKKITISGAITNHQYFRYDRSNIFFFVNKRWIKNHQLSNALLKGYLNAMPPGKYPAACIFIQVDPKEVDVNTHPRKEEVKFLHPRTVASLLQTTVKKALEEHLSAQLHKKVTLSSQDQQMRPQQTDNTYSSASSNFQPFNFDSFLKQSAQKTSGNVYTPQPAEQNVPEETPVQHSSRIEQLEQAQQPTPIQTSITPSYTQHAIEQQQYNIVGQFKRTYILIEKEDGLFFVDQHAAHERVLYQIFSKRFEEMATVKLLFPQIISLKEDDIMALERHLEIFKSNGIEIEVFGENQIIVQSTPVHIKDINMQELVQEVIAWIYEYQELDKDEFFKKVNEKMHAQMSCKAAIKAGDTMTIEQMEKLLADLEKTENRFTCPHGRPTGWILTIHDIEKKFKRKL